jgi:hypothetical protein
MPAPQQPRVPIYQASWKVPDPVTTRTSQGPISFDVSQSPGYALAKMLGVFADMAKNARRRQQRR